MKNTVGLDIMCWLRAVEAMPAFTTPASINPEAVDQLLPINGVYRHCDALSRIFNPIVLIKEREQVSKQALALLSRHIGKPIFVCRASEFLDDVYLSPAVDCFNEASLALNNRIKKAAIVHDALAYIGHFGADGVHRYLKGVKHSDALLFVSEYAREKLEHYRVPHFLSAAHIQYGSPHNFTENHIGLASRFIPKVHNLSVGNLFTRKCIPVTIALGASLLPSRHVHVGSDGDYKSSELAHKLKDKQIWFHHRSRCSDNDLIELYCNAQNYICLSEEEGFSMPAMEALILGVPNIILSDIPVHRELYEEYPSVVYCPDDVSKFDPRKLQVPTSQQVAGSVYERFHIDTLIQPFLEYLNAL